MTSWFFTYYLEVVMMIEERLLLALMVLVAKERSITVSMKMNFVWRFHLEVAKWKWPPILFLQPPLFIIMPFGWREAAYDNASVQMILNYEVIKWQWLSCIRKLVKYCINRFRSFLSYIILGMYKFKCQIFLSHGKDSRKVHIKIQDKQVFSL